MKFHIWRFIGILCFGTMLFFLAGMQSVYSFDNFFHYLFRDGMIFFYGFVFGLIGSAIFLSIENGSKDLTVS